MKRNQKIFGFVAVLLAVLVFGALTVSAQEPGDMPDDVWGCPCGMGGGRGMMNGNQPILQAAADTLGLEQAALWDELQSGKTLAEIAEAQGVELADLETAMLAASEVHMTWMVENGRMTQAEADEMLVYMQEHMQEHLNGDMNWGGMMGQGGMRQGHGMHGHHGHWGW